MKQRDLIKKLEDAGFAFERNGGNHDLYRRGKDIEKIPRHKEVNENLARMIIRETLIKAFPAPDLRRKAAFSAANPCASAGGSKEILI